jgi:hypothetical protein
MTTPYMPQPVTPNIVIQGATPTPYPDNNPKTVYGMAKPSVFNLPPAALLEMGAVMAFGANKYGRFNWREKRVSFSVYYDAAMRHLFAMRDGQKTDPESGLQHAAHVAACMMIVLDAADRGNLNYDVENEAFVIPSNALVRDTTTGAWQLAQPQPQPHSSLIG